MIVKLMKTDRNQNPKNVLFGITKVINILYTGILAVHVIKGVARIVINLSFVFSIFRVDIIEGTAQATPETRGTILFPLNPNGRKNLSIKNTTRAI